MATGTTPTTTEDRWLTCRIDKGMFSDEAAVTYPAQGKWQKSVFVPDSVIQGQPGETGKVRVVVVRQNGTIVAVLPSAERDIVTVQEADLTP
jgi:hypothetical protein